MSVLSLKLNPKQIVDGSRRAREALLGVASGAKKTESAIDKAAVSSKRLGGAMSKAGVAAKLFGAAIGIAGVAAFRSVISEQTKYQKNLNTIAAQLKTTSGVSGQTTKKLEAQSHALAAASLASIDDVQRAQIILLSFRHISGAAFDGTIQSALNLSEVLGQNLTSTILQVGKAMDNPILGMSMLSRSGTTFTQKQKDMAAALQKSGDLMGAQNIILKELTAEYGGAAAAAGKGLAGAFDLLSQRVVEFKLAIAKNAGLTGMTSAVKALASGIVFISDHLAEAFSILKVFAVFAGGRLVIALGAAVLGIRGMALSIDVLRVATARTGIGLLTVGIGELSYRLGLLGNATKIHETATYDVSAAMQSEITSSLQLNAQLQTNNTMTVRAAKAALVSAKARLEDAKATIAQTVAQARVAPQQNLDRVNRALQLARDTLSTIPARNAEAYNAQQNELVAILKRQKQAVEDLASAAAIPQALGDNLQIASENVTILQDALAQARDGVVQLGASVDAPIAKTKVLAGAMGTVLTKVQQVVGAMAGISAQGVSALADSQLKLKFKGDPLGLAGAQAAAKFGDVSGFDPILKNVLEPQKQAFIANAVATEKNVLALEKWRAAQTSAVASAGTVTVAVDAQKSAMQQYADTALQAGSVIENAMVGAFKSAESAFDKFIRTGTFNFRKFVGSLIADMARLEFKRSVLGPLSNIVSGLFGGGSSLAPVTSPIPMARPSVFHAGGIAGYGDISRSVPASVFNGARRMHSGGIAGLRADEVPAILQRGERVLSRRQTAASAGGNTSVQISLAPGLVANILSQASGNAVQISQQTVSVYDRKALPHRVNQIAQNRGVL